MGSEANDTPYGEWNFCDVDGEILIGDEHQSVVLWLASEETPSTAEAIAQVIVDAHNGEVRRLRGRLAEMEALMRGILDHADDRMFKAESGTWWRREGLLLVEADLPAGWRTAR